MTTSISAPVQSGNDEIRLIRDAYVGHTLPIATYHPLEFELARRIAVAYDALPIVPGDRLSIENAAHSYAALVREVDAQFEMIVENAFRVSFVDHDPYPTSSAMMEDVRLRRRLLVMRTAPSQRHPFLTPEQNDRFRAVHDLFGHAMERFQFGPRGEDNAWREHSRMFSPAALGALTTETRGQNCWVNFLAAHEGIPPALRPYAPQKFGLLPEWSSRS